MSICFLDGNDFALLEPKVDSCQWIWELRGGPWICVIPNFYDGLIPNKFEDLMMLSSASICLAPIKLERSYGECGERQKKGDINMSRSGYETMSFIHRTKGPVSNWKGPRKGWKFIYIYIYGHPPPEPTQTSISWCLAMIQVNVSAKWFSGNDSIQCVCYMLLWQNHEKQSFIRSTPPWSQTEKKRKNRKNRKNLGLW